MSQSLKNFLPAQYEETNNYGINHNYLFDQFNDKDDILQKISDVVKKGDFTLGEAVDRFELEFAKFVGVDHAIGVGSGTDAIFLSLKALGIGQGDEVVTSPFTFYATVGAIVTTGATPVFADIGPDLNIDPANIERVVTKNTKAIVPVHWAGKPCNMASILAVARRNNLFVVEDACHALGASSSVGNMGALGIAGCFSLHPLKNLNVWGDGGLICSNNSEFATKIKLLRNHGLINRDTCQVFGYNSRLDSIQAVVASHMLPKLPKINARRLENARYLDENLRGLSQINLVSSQMRSECHSFHLYSQLFKQRDKLKIFLNNLDIDAKIHYPVPIHLQPASSYLGYKMGDFPISEMTCSQILSLPIHEFIHERELEKMVKGIQSFYGA